MFAVPVLAGIIAVRFFLDDARAAQSGGLYSLFPLRPVTDKRWEVLCISGNTRLVSGLAQHTGDHELEKNEPIHLAILPLPRAGPAVYSGAMR